MRDFLSLDGITEEGMKPERNEGLTLDRQKSPDHELGFAPI